jgi:hypothetical protein
VQAAQCGYWKLHVVFSKNGKFSSPLYPGAPPIYPERPCSFCGQKQEHYNYLSQESWIKFTFKKQKTGLQVFIAQSPCGPRGLVSVGFRPITVIENHWGSGLPSAIQTMYTKQTCVSQGTDASRGLSGQSVSASAQPHPQTLHVVWFESATKPSKAEKSLLRDKCCSGPTVLKHRCWGKPQSALRWSLSCFRSLPCDEPSKGEEHCLTNGRFQQLVSRAYRNPEGSVDKAAATPLQIAACLDLSLLREEKPGCLGCTLESKEPGSILGWGCRTQSSFPPVPECTFSQGQCGWTNWWRPSLGWGSSFLGLVLTIGSFEPRGNTFQEKAEVHVCGKLRCPAPY